MKILVQGAQLVCAHTPPGIVQISPTVQTWVRVEGKAVLVQVDPVGKKIAGCPNVRPGIKPCLLTLPVQRGYSSLLRIDGKPICLDTVAGLTDGTPPGAVEYTVRRPGQDLVSEV